ncbi:winged helix-turn-helix domain-containing protein [Idiomarina xiamenensis]|uniref:Two component transcriptional regulator, winged helix family protein n=1 Tax=Idiomarina xiamenensis 10-D-4 TaxID=740709 RepID=K2KFT9_9GAMM|nr:two component transcriptional regulator, winged helix family protein [Idiomarina xiamenensis 10-D-4]
MTQQQQQANDNQIGDLHISTTQREVRCQQQVLPLTGLEYEIILLLSKTPGQTVAKQQLSEQCLGRKLTPFDRSVDTHVSNIRKKLQQAGSRSQIQSQRGKGYSLVC